MHSRSAVADRAWTLRRMRKQTPASADFPHRAVRDGRAATRWPLTATVAARFATVRGIEPRRQGRRAPKRADIRTRVPDQEVAEVQNVRFSTALRGYDRDEVDRYISRVNNVLAELQITAAPQSAIKAALEQVSRQTRSVVQEAEQEAEEITRQSRSRADDRIQEATQEAQKLHEAAEQQARRLREAAAHEARGTTAAAEARIRDLEADVQAMIERRDRAIAELVELSRSLDELLKRNGTNGDRPSVPEPTGANRGTSSSSRPSP